MSTCPKCGAAAHCERIGGYAVIYKCNSSTTVEGWWGESLECKTRQIARLTAALVRERRVSARLAQMCAVDWCQPGPCPVDKDGESLDCAACVMLQAEAEADNATNAPEAQGGV